MRVRELKSKAVLGLGTLALIGLLTPGRGGRSAFADERPRASSAVQVPVQGGGGVEPLPGAPSPVAPSLESRLVNAIPGPRPSSSGVESAGMNLRAISTAEDEATLEIDGVRETVRAGSRLGRDTVKSVGPGRLVLERPASGARGGASLVIVTFDETGRSKTRVIWTTDPAAPAAPEVERP